MIQKMKKVLIKKYLYYYYLNKNLKEKSKKIENNK